MDVLVGMYLRLFLWCLQFTSCGKMQLPLSQQPRALRASDDLRGHELTQARVVHCNYGDNAAAVQLLHEMFSAETRGARRYGFLFMQSCTNL